MNTADFPVFDIHTHIYPDAIAARATQNLGAFYDFEVQGRGTYADLEQTGAAHGVKGFLILSVATNAHQVTKVNDFAAAAVTHARERGFLAAGFGGMHQDFADMPAELERMLSIGLCGVKLHPDIQGADIDDPRFFPLYESMQGRVPLYLHMGDDRPQYRFSEPRKLLHLLQLFPRLTVGAAHFGGYRAWRDAEVLAGHPNVWFDTSSALWAMSPDAAARLVRLFGTERLMFGTDYPVKTAGEELERFFAIPGLTEAERRAVLFDNAVRFLGL